MAESLSVLMTADGVGGVFTYALTLASTLADAGATIHLATMGDALRPEQRAAAQRIDRLVLHESTFALEWMNNRWDQLWRSADWLRAIERAVAPDVIHLASYAHALARFTAPVAVVGHSCVLSWWESVFGTVAPVEWDRYRERVRSGLLAADVVLAPSGAMMRALERHYLGKERVPRRVVPNGLPPLPSRSAEKEPFVLSAGRIWDRAKNIEALAAVARRLPWPVAVAGADVHSDGKKRPLTGVENLGWLDGAALGAQMDRAAIFALPAKYEPFGLCPLEAAQRGCALVLGDIDSLREIWGDAAIFVPPDDGDALVHAIEQLAADRDLRDRLGRHAQSRAATYTAKRMADETVAAWEFAAQPSRLRAESEPLSCA